MSHSHEIYESYLESVSMVQQQIDSYNRFIHIGLNKIVESQNTIEPDVANFAIKFKGIRLEMPKVIESDSSTRSILPHEAISRNLTYAAPMYITYVPVIAGSVQDGKFFLCCFSRNEYLKRREHKRQFENLQLHIF